VVLTFPLIRMLQTTTAGFPQVVRKVAVDRAQLIIGLDLQEHCDLPCDTGSTRVALEEASPGLDFGGDLGGEWFVKEALYAADDIAIAK
jgi:hypothetical protein